MHLILMQLLYHYLIYLLCYLGYDYIQTQHTFNWLARVLDMTSRNNLSGIYYFYRCSIWCDFFCMPVKLPWGHRFCKVVALKVGMKCIKGYISNLNRFNYRYRPFWKRICPLCRYQYTFEYVYSIDTKFDEE